MSKYQRTKEQCFMAWGEYNSKRNLRPKRPFEIRTERMDRCDEYLDIKGQQGMPKLMRYEFRSVYGSKY